MPPPSPGIQPATLAYSDDGIPFSQAFGDVYHSSDGGLGQAQHVFLAGNGLPARWRGRERFVILETGFGLGLNFLATWQAWRQDAQRPARLHFLSVEKHPFSAADLALLHQRWPEFGELSGQLLRQWPPLVPGFHRLQLDEGRVVLTLMFGDALACLPQVAASVDGFYLDGFAPAKNPELWSDQLFRSMKRLAGPGATAATYTVATVVRDGLKRVGFICEKRPGFGRKRDMLAAQLHAAVPRTPPASAGERSAIVIGAGIAGCSAAYALSRRGWQVTLLEQRDAPGRQASGNHVGLLLPLLARDDNRAARLSRASLLFALRSLVQLQDAGFTPRWGRSGVLQLAKSAANDALLQATVTELGLPPDFAQYLDAAAVSARLGSPAQNGGVYFPVGAWANPPSICAALLAACGDGLNSRFYSHTTQLQRQDDQWQALDDQGQLMAQAPQVIIAAGAEAVRLEPCRQLPLRAIRGQVSHLPEALFAAPDLGICREGYVTPAVDGLACVGASFDVGDDDAAPRLSDHLSNLAHLERLLPGRSHNLAAEALSGKVGFRPAALDRLPLIGALPCAEAGQPYHRLSDIPRWPGIHGMLGFGSRGLVWALLAAEILASQLEGDPAPVEQDVLDATDPARFVLRGRQAAAAEGDDTDC